MNSHDDVSTAVDIATQVITILKRWLCYFFDLDFDFKKNVLKYGTCNIQNKPEVNQRLS